MVILVMVFFLLSVERLSRRNARFHRQSRAARPVAPIRLKGWKAAAALGLCLVPFSMGFLLPVAVMAGHAISKPKVWLADGLAAAALNTVVVGGIAAVMTVSGALFLVYAVRMAGRKAARLVLPLTTLGYAAPGAVLAVGLLIPLAALDHRVADAVLAVTGRDPGLLLTGTSAAVSYTHLDVYKRQAPVRSNARRKAAMC